MLGTCILISVTFILFNNNTILYCIRQFSIPIATAPKTYILPTYIFWYLPTKNRTKNVFRGYVAIHYVQTETHTHIARRSTSNYSDSHYLLNQVSTGAHSTRIFTIQATRDGFCFTGQPITRDSSTTGFSFHLFHLYAHL